MTKNPRIGFKEELKPKRVLKGSEITAYFCIVLFVMGGVAESSNLVKLGSFAGSFNSVLLLLTIVLGGLSYITSRPTIRDFLYKLLLAMVVIPFGLWSKNFNFIPLFFVLISSNVLSMSNAIRCHMYTLAICVGIVVGLFYLNLIPDSTMLREFQVRSSLGFVHPNVTGLYFFTLFVEWVCLSTNRKRTLFRLLIGISGSILIFEQTNSRTSFFAYCVFCVIILGFLFTKVNLSSKSRFIVSLYPEFFLVITLVTIKAFGRSVAWAVKLNELLSDRLNQMNIALKSINNLFFEQNGNVNFNLRLKNIFVTEDNVFMFFIINAGTIALIVFLAYISIRNYKINKHNEYALFCIGLFCLIAYGFMESGVYSIIGNPFLLGATGMIGKEQLKRERHTTVGNSSGI